MQLGQFRNFKDDPYDLTELIGDEPVDIRGVAPGLDPFYEDPPSLVGVISDWERRKISTWEILKLKVTALLKLEELIIEIERISDKSSIKDLLKVRVDEIIEPFDRVYPKCINLEDQGLATALASINRVFKEDLNKGNDYWITENALESIVTRFPELAFIKVALDTVDTFEEHINCTINYKKNILSLFRDLRREFPFLNVLDNNNCRIVLSPFLVLVVGNSKMLSTLNPEQQEQGWYRPTGLPFVLVDGSKHKDEQISEIFGLELHRLFFEHVAPDTDKFPPDYYVNKNKEALDFAISLGDQSSIDLHKATLSNVTNPYWLINYLKHKMILELSSGQVPSLTDFEIYNPDEVPPFSDFETTGREVTKFLDLLTSIDYPSMPELTAQIEKNRDRLETLCDKVMKDIHTIMGSVHDGIISYKEALAWMVLLKPHSYHKILEISQS